MSKKTRKKKFKIGGDVSEEMIQPIEHKPKQDKYTGNKFLEFYFNNYKALFVIPILILIISLGLIGFKLATTGEFINKGVSLKGGTTFTITDAHIEISDLESYLYGEASMFEVSVRKLTEGSRQIGVIVETDATKVDDINFFTDLLEKKYDISDDDLSIETMGSSLGKSFFKQTFRALILAFVFMAVVVFLYFRSFAPSIAVVLAAFSDMVITMAIVNIAGIKLTTAGIAAFLMLIGYSVDTDILLTTKVLKAKEGTVYSNMLKAMKTGLTMTGTTIIAVSVALMVAESGVIKQIMTILLIGLCVDIINTWIQNAAIIRWYVERRNKHDKA